jgi:NPCBM-associated, NEW3 domain of alpha-galactosidase
MLPRYTLALRLRTSAWLGHWPGARLGSGLVSLCLLGLMLWATTELSQAHQAPSPKPPPLAENLTQDLVALSTRHQLADPAEKAQLLHTLLTVATERQQLLAALAENDPGEVVRVALPADLRASLPPAVQALVEDELEVEGELEILHEDRDVGSRYLYALKTTGGRFALHFAADPPTHLETGTRVRVTGVRVEQMLALSSSTTSVETLASALPNTFGAQKTLVILVNFADKATQPYTVATAQSVVFTTTSNFDLENSYGQTWLTGNVVGWYTIALSSTVCDYSTLASQAKSAAQAAGVNLSAYTRYVYAFPQNACTWWGLGSVGGNPSQAWINGSLQLKVVSHEMGHNLGLYHAHSLDCGTTVLGTNCTTSDYGDTIDTMGNPAAGHYNAFQKERLGWLDYGTSPTITTVQAAGTYTIAPLETAGTGPKALAVLKATDPSTGKQTWYYVEYRQALGFDSFLSSNSNVLNGVVIHTGSTSDGNSSYLLDLTPTTSSWSDPALSVGQSFYDPDAGVTIAPLSVSGTGATVSVSLTAPPCAPANPTMTLTPSQSQWVQPGSPVSFTVSVTNNDSPSCAVATLSLQSTVPTGSTGWTATFTTPTLTLSPGASASTTLQVSSPATAVGGFYTIGVTATNSANPAYTASTSATVVLVTGLSVTVTAAPNPASRGQAVTSTAAVSANGAPVANASVTFTITKANGTVVKQTATTDAAGKATSKLQLKRNDPVGTYQDRADATLNGIVGSATTSFTVQ